ncbi:cardiolipin synthase [Lacticaseibacillus baoqingensis]|uniref:Cardiolipin synthase n=1 Tax=Lacticaseibacillus baoqingensis TaxID=2486013 RepID=A0ABW4E1B6_9LACO|nr:cardiolipin synthase [Lacticaseibacillus baoqingensis]
MVIGLIALIIVINAILAMITVFYQSRDIASTWAWLLVLLVLPVLGAVLFWIFGRKLSSDKLTALATQQRLGIDQMVAAQREAISVGHDLIGNQQGAGVPELVRTLLQSDGALVTTMNAVKLISQRDDYTNALFADIAAASEHIHIEAYTIQPDATGRQLRRLLVAKAAAGVRVRVLYDAFGSHRLSARWWRPLRQAGGQVEPFFATKMARANPRINFRDHRKLTVIDGQIGYMGGFDIGDSPKHLTIHRDTQLRLCGQAVAVLQARFFMDWNTMAKIKKVHFQSAYFPDAPDIGHTTMQIVSSGPEQAQETLKLGYFRLITMAKHSIWIQTPYFVPDDSLLDALLIAANAGIDVRIMVPKATNQPLMAKATMFYLDRIVAGGGHVYLYDQGFLHAKAVIVDERIVATGTANFDIRSFRLNFELAAFLYDPQLAQQAADQFRQDRCHATRYTAQMAAQKPRRKRVAEEWSRLLAPIL